MLATVTSPGTDETMTLRLGLLATLTWPGLALLGAGLAPAAIGSRVDAAAAGVALAIGAPVAAVLSTAIGVATVVAVRDGARVDDAIGATIRFGVLGALRYAPFVAIAVIAWVLLVRRSASAH